ncbi:membrane protein [Shewanella mangrovi]|uniref:Membrane protein n=1 Tax=Shewanella mangrovi TaxID=1515746 RepID=A0A094J9U7_9GAMM|nr:DUF3392 domain-containing protein [Shewanella mangrovi]KFZ36017.1 membrane protein [Shewanella mangrovi]
MDLIVSFLSRTGAMLHPWMNEIATAMVSCIIVVFGADCNRWLRQQLGARSFILRTLIFIVVNAFGFGLLIVAVSPWLAGQLRHMPAMWMLLLVCAVFFLIGSWAQRNRQS